MGDIISLDKGAVLAVVKLYTPDVKEAFEKILICFQIERELRD